MVIFLKRIKRIKDKLRKRKKEKLRKLRLELSLGKWWTKIGSKMAIVELESQRERHTGANFVDKVKLEAITGVYTDAKGDLIYD